MRVDEEPYLIFANRYYLRKLNLDGTNYTLIKQVRHTDDSLKKHSVFFIFNIAPSFSPPQGLNNAVALDFHYAEQMIYWTDVTTQGSMIRRMHMNGSSMEVSENIWNPFVLI